MNVLKSDRCSVDIYGPDRIAVTTSKPRLAKRLNERLKTYPDHVVFTENDEVRFILSWQQFKAIFCFLGYQGSGVLESVEKNRSNASGDRLNSI